MYKVITTTCCLFTRRYWQRRWIVQELYHATLEPVEIRWGPCVFHGLNRLTSRTTCLWGILDCANILYSLEEELANIGIATKGEFKHVPHVHFMHEAIRGLKTLKIDGSRSQPQDRIFKILDKPWTNSASQSVLMIVTDCTPL